MDLILRQSTSAQRPRTDLIQVDIAARRPTAADRIKNAAILQHGCPATVLKSGGVTDGSK